MWKIFVVAISWSCQLSPKYCPTRDRYTVCISPFMLANHKHVHKHIHEFSGRELMMASTSMSAVLSSSKVGLAFPIVFLKHLLTDLMRRSKTPSHHGALGILNIFLTLRSSRCAWTSG